MVRNCLVLLLLLIYLTFFAIPVTAANENEQLKERIDKLEKELRELKQLLQQQQQERKEEKAKVEELGERVWDEPAIEARIRKLSAEGIPKKTLNPDEILSNKPQILDRVQRRAEEYNFITKNCAQGTALSLM